MTGPAWTGEGEDLRLRAPRGLEWVRVIRRGVPAISVIVVCLLILLLMRLIERPLFGQKRPITPFITRFVCRSVLYLIGFQLRLKGRPMTQLGAVVANHSSWLDIFTLNALQRIYFVSKSEVSAWPGIGILAKATGTVFIARERKEAKRQTDLFEQRLRAGHKLLFFPEGTSSDAIRVLPFKSTLFEAFFRDELRDIAFVQPVAVNYHAPDGADPRFYGWWGDMDLIPNVLHVLSTPKQGLLELVFQDPLPVSGFENRKQLTVALENSVRQAHLSANSIK